MRFPSTTTPLPVASPGEALAHGRATSGARMVEKIFTTELSTTPAPAGAGAGAPACARVRAGRSPARRGRQERRRMWCVSKGSVAGDGADGLGGGAEDAGDLRLGEAGEGDAQVGLPQRDGPHPVVLEQADP